jgi:predicted aldo/keto reductase-like oxidoreductase
MMGKMIQVEEKKEVKKGAKEPKDQEVKMIDKYCRLMVEKSPQMMDMFEDSIATISEEYYDYVSLFV